MKIVQFAFHIILLSWPLYALAQELALAKDGCQLQCGEVKISYPFGIGDNCFAEEWFEIVCDDSKPFLKFINLEILEISVTGTIRVLGPVLYLGYCNHTVTGPFDALVGSPFVFSQYLNKFFSVTCGYLVLMNQATTNIGGCTSICDIAKDSIDPTCNGINCCQAAVPEYLVVLNVTLLDLSLPELGFSRCKYAFVAEKACYEKNVADLNVAQDMTEVPVVLDWRLYNYTLHDFGLNDSAANSPTFSCRNKSYLEPITFARFPGALQCSCNGGYAGNPYLPGGCQGFMRQDDGLNSNSNSNTNIMNMGVMNENMNNNIVNQNEQVQPHNVVREQDQYKPIANVIRIMRRILPAHAKIPDDAKETIQECVSEYTSFVTGEANERCQREQRKSITAEDVLWATGKLGFDDYGEYIIK